MVKRLFVLGKEAGFSGLFAGLGPRISEYPFSHGQIGSSHIAEHPSHDCWTCGLPVDYVRIHQGSAWCLCWNRDPQGGGRDSEIERDEYVLDDHMEDIIMYRSVVQFQLYAAGVLCGIATLYFEFVGIDYISF